MLCGRWSRERATTSRSRFRATTPAGPTGTTPTATASANVPVASGMAGAIVVEGDFADVPEIARARGAPARPRPRSSTMPYGSVESFETLFPKEARPASSRSMGSASRSFRMRPGEVQRWRMLTHRLSGRHLPGPGGPHPLSPSLATASPSGRWDQPGGPRRRAHPTDNPAAILSRPASASTCSSRRTSARHLPDARPPLRPRLPRAPRPAGPHRRGGGAAAHEPPHHATPAPLPRPSATTS